MKQEVEKRKVSGVVDYIALALTTFGVGYIPGAPGTYGSVIGVAIYSLTTSMVAALVDDFATSRVNPNCFFAYQTCMFSRPFSAVYFAVMSISLLGFCLIGIWASGRSIPLLGNDDPSEAVVDEVIGQLITFCFVPFGLSWPFILAGFLLFRVFDIWKPYPINNLQNLSGGLGICADDIVAGVYAGICLAIGYAVYVAI